MDYSLSFVFIFYPWIGETPLIHAARQGHTATAKYLVKCGADPSIPSELGAAALHHSAGIGKHFPVLYCLLSSLVSFGLGFLCCWYTRLF